MLRIWAIFVAVIFAGPGFALGPAELPPPDFPARQYIDSTGCVFLRDDAGGWQPRLYRDGSSVCGYPPSMSARRLEPDGMARLFPDTNPAPARADQIERALTEQIIPNLHTGELTGERSPLVPLPDAGPEPASQEPAQMLAAAVKAQPKLRAEMGRGLQPNRQLCQLLNYGETPPQDAGIGRDPTEGFCDGLSRNELSRLAFVRPAAMPAGGKVATAAFEQSRAAPAMVDPKGKSNTGADSLRRSNTPLRKAETSTPHPDRFQMPRFIRIGAFRTEQQMTAVAQQVVGIKLPVVRQKPKDASSGSFILLAGPFEDRQTLVIALDRIRRAGFPGAAPL